MHHSIRATLSVLCLSFMLYSTHAHAFDLSGAWAGDTSICQKIFVKKKSGISITRNSDVYGSGFIVEGNKIRGKMATCNITSRKEEAGILNIIAVCSTDIALSTTQFQLKIDGDDKVTRLFPGMPDLTFAYVRCAL
jgi:hypothetical protein